MHYRWMELSQHLQQDGFPAHKWSKKLQVIYINDRKMREKKGSEKQKGKGREGEHILGNTKKIHA